MHIWMFWMIALWPCASSSLPVPKLYLEDCWWLTVSFMCKLWYEMCHHIFPKHITLQSPGSTNTSAIDPFCQCLYGNPNFPNPNFKYDKIAVYIVEVPCLILVNRSLLIWAQASDWSLLFFFFVFYCKSNSEWLSNWFVNYKEQNCRGHHF